MDERDFVDRTNQETEMTEPVRRVRLEPISKLSEEDNEAGKLDEAEEVVG
jgi:hypothetical protein